MTGVRRAVLLPADIQAMLAAESLTAYAEVTAHGPRLVVEGTPEGAWRMLLRLLSPMAKLAPVRAGLTLVKDGDHEANDDATRESNP